MVDTQHEDGGNGARGVSGGVRRAAATSPTCGVSTVHGGCGQNYHTRDVFHVSKGRQIQRAVRVGASSVPPSPLSR